MGISIGIGVTGSVMPNANTIHDMEGTGSAIGISGGFLENFGVDWVNPNTNNQGISFGLGVGLGGEWHMERTNTILAGSLPRLGPDPCPNQPGYCGDTGTIPQPHPKQATPTPTHR